MGRNGYRTVRERGVRTTYRYKRNVSISSRSQAQRVNGLKPQYQTGCSYKVWAARRSGGSVTLEGSLHPSTSSICGIDRHDRSGQAWASRRPGQRRILGRAHRDRRRIRRGTLHVPLVETLLDELCARKGRGIDRWQ